MSDRKVLRCKDCDEVFRGWGRLCRYCVAVQRILTGGRDAEA